MLHPALALPTSLCTLKTLAKRCLFLHGWPLHRGDEHHEVKCLSMREKGMELLWPRRDRGVWAGRTWKDIRIKKEEKWMHGGVSKGRSWRGKKRTGLEVVFQRKKRRKWGKRDGQWHKISSGKDWDVSGSNSAKTKPG